MSSDKSVLFDILESEFYEFDQRAQINYARSEGRKEGRMEGRKEGQKEGRKEGKNEIIELWKKGYTIEQVEQMLGE